MGFTDYFLEWVLRTSCVLEAWAQESSCGKVKGFGGHDDRWEWEDILNFKDEVYRYIYEGFEGRWLVACIFTLSADMNTY